MAPKLLKQRTLRVHRRPASAVVSNNMSDAATDGRTKMNGRVHAVLLTLPFSGHMNPMLHLARRLASIPDAVRRVTFVLSNSVQHRPPSFSPPPPPPRHDPPSGELSFVYIPDGTPAEDQSRYDTVQLLEMMENCFVRHFEEDVLVPLLRRNEQQQQEGNVNVNGDVGSNVDDNIVVIANAFIPGADRAARKHGVPFVSFWPQSAASFAHLLDVVGHGYRPPPGTPPSALISIPGIPVPVELQDFNGFLNTFDPENYMYRLFAWALDTSRGADCVVMNTFEELEMGTLEFLRQEMKPQPVVAVGPLLPDWFLEEMRRRRWKGQKVRSNSCCESKAPSHSAAAHAGGGCGAGEGEANGGSRWATKLQEEEWRRCMAWLEAQEEETVVYVSFGSMASAGEKQVKEMAEGLEGSGAKFVWSLKNKEKVLEKGWEERMEAEGRGLVMEWAPQLELLAHPAIAAFLTHCGWNSTIEAMSAGVPMLAWRTGVSDQALNARLAADAWHQAILLNAATGVAAANHGESHIAKSFTSTSLLSGDEVRRKIWRLWELKKKMKGEAAEEEPTRWCRAALSAPALAESSLRMYLFAISMRETASTIPYQNKVSRIFSTGCEVDSPRPTIICPQRP